MISLLHHVSAIGDHWIFDYDRPPICDFLFRSRLGFLSHVHVTLIPTYGDLTRWHCLCEHASNLTSRPQLKSIRRTFSTFLHGPPRDLPAKKTNCEGSFVVTRQKKNENPVLLTDEKTATLGLFIILWSRSTTASLLCCGTDQSIATSWEAHSPFTPINGY